MYVHILSFQFPKLSDSHAEPRSVVRGLLKIIGIIIGAALFVTGVCIVCCCCCPFCLCAKHRKGTVLRQGAEQIPPDQSQQQPLSQQPQAQPPFQGNEALFMGTSWVHLRRGFLGSFI